MVRMMPKGLNFEKMTHAFMDLASQPYISAEKVKSKAAELGVKDSLIGQIIVFEQFRDAIHKVSLPEIFGDSIDRRNQVYDAIIDCLTDLYDELEDKARALDMEVDVEEAFDMEDDESADAWQAALDHIKLRDKEPPKAAPSPEGKRIEIDPITGRQYVPRKKLEGEIWDDGDEEQVETKGKEV